MLPCAGSWAMSPSSVRRSSGTIRVVGHAERQAYLIAPDVLSETRLPAAVVRHRGPVGGGGTGGRACRQGGAAAGVHRATAAVRDRLRRPAQAGARSGG